MIKKEIIWRHILHESLTKQVRSFTQKDIAAHFRISTSTVFSALKAPRKLGAIQVTGRFFRLTNAEKLLLLWATQRNLNKDLMYATHVDASVRSIEGNMPPFVVFGAFSAYRFAYKDAPSDYDVVYVYCHDLQTVKSRFPKKKGHNNLFVLNPDPYLFSYGSTTPDVQTFTDLWNLPQWYAKDFLEALKYKLLL